MPHLGKQYPLQWKGFFQILPFTQGNGPTRKLQIWNGGVSSVGTIANLWRLAIPVVSEVADYSTVDPLWINYHFVHPSDPDATIDWRFKFIENPFSPGPGNEFLWHTRCTPTYAGVELCWQESYTSVNFAWSHDTGGHIVGPAWNDVVDPALWQTQVLIYDPATWAQQPEYQPYRTNPF